MGVNLREYANGQKIYVYGKKCPRGCLSPPLGYIHINDHNIHAYSSLKPLGQSKPNFMLPMHLNEENL